MPTGARLRLGPETLAGRPTRRAECQVGEFRLEAGLPVWRFETDDAVLEKRLLIPHLQNTAYVAYQLVGGRVASVQLQLRPLVHFRSHDAAVDAPHPGPYALTAWGDRYEISVAGPMPPLRMVLDGKEPAFTLDTARTTAISFRLESQRGYPSVGDQWSPGFFHAELTADEPVVLVASAESWETMRAMRFDEALRAERHRRSRLLKAARRSQPGEDAFHAELVLAADEFVIKPAGRVEDATRAKAAGEDIRTVIAGYHWFTDWGRDTMISLEGLTLSTGRAAEAEFILRTFAHYVRDGLIPNMFPEGETEGLYHTADASLWFFHAVSRYVSYTDDRETLAALPAPADRDRRPAHRGHRLRHRRRSKRRPAASGRRGLPAHLDGRQGRRLGRHPAARQGGRDQRPLVQRAATAGGLGARDPRRRARRDVRPVRRESPGVVQPAVLVRGRRPPLRRRRRRARG